MKLLVTLIFVLASAPSWGWIVTRAGCRTQAYPENKDIITYSSIDFEVGPQAKAVFSQTAQLENNPPNIGIHTPDYAKFGFFLEVRKINPTQNPLAALFGTPQFDGFVAENGSLFTHRGSVKPAKVVVTFTKRFSDGEPHGARIDIYTKENNSDRWDLIETFNECYLSVMH